MQLIFLYQVRLTSCALHFSFTCPSAIWEFVQSSRTFWPSQKFQLFLPSLAQKLVRVPHFPWHQRVDLRRFLRPGSFVIDVQGRHLVEPWGLRPHRLEVFLELSKYSQNLQVSVRHTQKVWATNWIISPWFFQDSIFAHRCRPTKSADCTCRSIYACKIQASKTIAIWRHMHWSLLPSVA